ncbi:hypothetical protein AMECASPLE_026048 [Ameca splendens]|uniref:Uncharacterized protein n=1 Tax=Ameca splendens TaxID=208324 RepID=A0ABV1A1V4_9TELE
MSTGYKSNSRKCVAGTKIAAGYRKAPKKGYHCPFFCQQVGHEPLPPTVGKNLFGRQVQQLPGLFAYGKPNPANNSVFTFITLIRMCLSMLNSVAYYKWI